MVDRARAQQDADRIRLLRDELQTGEAGSVLELTPEQQSRFEEWSRSRLQSLASRFDVDTNVSQKRVSWGMRLASTLGSIAICAAIVLFFYRYWGYLGTSAQLITVIAMPIVLLAATEFMACRERTRYFTGLLALVAMAAFVLNLSVMGSVLNIASTERALLPWAAFALLLGYRYGLRLMLCIGLILLIGYVAAAERAQMGYSWLDFYDRPEQFLFLGALLFAVPLYLKHSNNTDFAAVYRLVGALTMLLAVLSLAEWGVPSYLPWSDIAIERFYEIFGLTLSAGFIWLGIVRDWTGVVNTGACSFTVFLFIRLFRWWWDWMPRYLFFAIIGALGILLVLAFKRVHRQVAT